MHRSNCLFRIGRRVLKLARIQKLYFILVASAIMSFACCAFANADDDESFLLKLPAPHSKEADEQEARMEAKQAAEQATKQAIGGLNQNQARQYVVSLINRDRAVFKRRPVALDELSSKAGQGHTDEMAKYGYIAHWGMDGKKPDQRYTEGGGRDADSENTYLSDTAENPSIMPLQAEPIYQKADLEEMESLLFNEKPPNDGHRVNILAPEHNFVGIALSQAGKGEDSRMACTQEFVDRFGEFSEIPTTLKLGQTFKVEGKLSKGVDFYSVELCREDLPKPMTVKALNATGGYSAANESVATFWPGHYKTAAPVTLETVGDTQAFSVDIHLSTTFKKGVYYVGVWAKTEFQKDPIEVSVRTIVVE